MNTVVAAPVQLVEHQLRAMIDLQADMNARVDPDWLTAGYPYLRAVVVEGAEAMEHHGWKWWKQQVRDMPHLRMELIDIWHFILSYLLVEYEGDRNAVCDHVLCHRDADGEAIFDSKRYMFDDLDVVSKIELMVGLAVARRTNISLFSATMADCGMTWSELYVSYVGKNVLNFFRQHHGYKDGSYRKVWRGVEDNQHLIEVLRELDSGDPDFPKQLWIALSGRYEKVAA